MLALARRCHRFRELLVALMGRELKARYRGSILGGLWMILQPLFYLIIYFVVFSQLFQQRMGDDSAPTSLFALAMFAGLVPWIVFAETLARGAGCVLENGNLIKKFAFPTELLPVYLVGVSLINALLGFVILAAGCLAFLPGWHLPRMLWLFPPMLLFQGIFTLGLVYLISSIAVYVRDLIQMVPMAVTFWFFLSPIFLFAKDPATPELLAQVLRWNPVTYLIAVYREIFIWTPEYLEKLHAAGARSAIAGKEATVALPVTAPGDIPWFEAGVFAGSAILILFIGLKVFRKLEPGFSDEV